MQRLDKTRQDDKNDDDDGDDHDFAAPWSVGLGFETGSSRT